MDQPAMTGMSMDQLLAILNNMNEKSDERMMKFVQELKKPSAEEQAKADKEKAKLRERTLASAKVAMAEEQGKANAAKNCPHGTTHKGTGVFKHQWRAQVHTPAGEKPYYIPRCTQCGSTWDRVVGASSPKILATTEQLQNGVSLDEYGPHDLERLFDWAKRNPVEELAVA